MMPQRVCVTEGRTSMTCRRKQATCSCCLYSHYHGAWSLRWSGEGHHSISPAVHCDCSTDPLPPHQTRASVSTYVSSAAVRVYLVRRGVGQPQYTGGWLPPPQEPHPRIPANAPLKSRGKRFCRNLGGSALIIFWRFISWKAPEDRCY